MGFGIGQRTSLIVTEVGISASRWTGGNQKGENLSLWTDPHHSAGKVCVCGWRWGGGVVLIGSAP